VSAKLEAALRECWRHSDTLVTALREIAAIRPVTPARVANLGVTERRVLDQIAYRYAKLQDSLGETVLPGLLELAAEPLAPNALFAEKLHRLERLGAIASAQRWKFLREVRNTVAHEYPDEPEIQAAIVERLLNATGELIEVWRGVEAFVNRLRPTP
jgi:hypothetical protein